MLIYKELDFARTSELDSITDLVYREKLCSLTNEYENGKIFAVYENGCLYGWCFLFIPDSLQGSCFVFVYVNSFYRRHGYGTAIYLWAEEKMKTSGHNWWSSYPADDGADAFALAVGFDYTSPNSFMVYEGAISLGAQYNLISPISITDTSDTEMSYFKVSDRILIRPYKDRDYPEAADIWTNEYTKMHRDLGLPWNDPIKSEKDRVAERAHYLCNQNLYFVVEKDGQTAGIGGLFDDISGIGMLAIDSKFQGQGLGTVLTKFLIREAIRLGNSKPCIYCETNNTAAFHVYEKAGFVEKIRESTAIKR